MILSIISCVFWPLVCLLWRNIGLGLLPIFWLNCFLYWAAWTWAACIFVDWSFVSYFICKYFLPLWELSFHLVYVFFCSAKAFKIRSHFFFVLFCFYFHYSWRWVTKDLAMIYVKECSAYEFCSVWTYI